MFMKKLLILIIVFFVFFSIGKAERRVQNLVKKKVIIKGKILNCDPKIKYISIYVFRIGFDGQLITAKINKNNIFHAEFESYVPTDVSVSYDTNFLVLTHPGDKIYFEFDGRYKKRPGILKTIKFKGDSKKTNQDAAAFQYLFYTNPLNYDWIDRKRAQKEYDTKQYLNYLDSRRKKWKKVYNNFVKKFLPNEETKVWASMLIDNEYYLDLFFYPSAHKRRNNLNSKNWDVPLNYYSRQLERLPIIKIMFIGGYTLSNFINRFHMGYVRYMVWNENKHKTVDNWKTNFFKGIIKYTEDPILRQLVLTEFLFHELSKLDTACFDKNLDLVNKYVKEPFLKGPLFKLYSKVSGRVINPKIASAALIKNTLNSSANKIFKNILAINKGKVIYVDCWATWCKPCTQEMPKSKKLIKKFKGKNVAFVFICLDSEKKIFKAMLDELKIGGQHYFLDKEQSSALRETLKIIGIPHYFLINKTGTIIEKGHFLRPDIMTPKIEKLLKL